MNGSETTLATPAVRRDPLSRQIYEILREGIIRGRWPQGTRLAEQRLAEELEVSRVPLREAVPQLVRDGFVTTAPHRGAVVSSWDATAVHELFDLRLCLEVGAARYAARQVERGASVEPLRHCLAQAREVVGSGDPYAIAATSTRFHECIVELTGNALMSSLMQSVSGRMMWLFHLSSQLPATDALDEHVALCAAVASGDERVAEAMAYAHIERDRMPTLQALALP